MTDTTSLLPDVDLNALFAENALAITENRTVKLIGQGYGANPVNISVLFDNIIEIYNGEIPTIDQVVPTSATGNETALFTFPVGVTWTGTASLTITVSSGTLTISNILADHNRLELPGATESFYRINSHSDAWSSFTTDVWSNVTIDDVAQEPSNFYIINEGSTIALTINVLGGTYTTLCPDPNA